MKIRRWKVNRVFALPRARRWRVLARRAAGGVLLGVGVILLILPGPGIPFVLAGLVLLEWDAEWLRQLEAPCSPWSAPACAAVSTYDGPNREC